MANGHGGARVGSGRKPKSAAERRLAGKSHHKVLQHPSAPALASTSPAPAAADASQDLVNTPPPARFGPEECAIWNEYLPQIKEAGTLKKIYLGRFEMLCEDIVAERWHRKIGPHSPDHSRAEKAVDAGFGFFALRPFGKAVVSDQDAKPVVDPLKEKYFGRA